MLFITVDGIVIVVFEHLGISLPDSHKMMSENNITLHGIFTQFIYTKLHVDRAIQIKYNIYLMFNLINVFFEFKIMNKILLAEQNRANTLYIN